MDLTSISFSVSNHAWERACQAETQIPVRDIEQTVLDTIRTGTQFGSQAGNDFLVKPTSHLFGGYVFVCSPMTDKRYATVRTVLREDHAVANSQAFFGVESPKQMRRFTKKQKRKQILKERDHAAE